jgi:membrane associated rhomboid family serine protease
VLPVGKQQQQQKLRRYTVQSPDRRKGNLSITSRIVLLNVVAYVLQVFNPNITRWGLKLSDRIRRGEELYRLFTPMFLHGGLAHLATNTYSLQAVGPDVEQYFGPSRFLFTYLVSGITGNLFSAFKSPNPSLGASGAVFGMIGAYTVFLIRNEDFFGNQAEYMIGALTRTIGMNLIYGVLSPMVDNWAHIGGALGGAIFTYYFGPRLYLAELPDGTRTLVDDPILKLPRSLEAIPERFGDRLAKMKRRLQVNRFVDDLPERPWRPRQNYRQRRGGVPDRSIRPGPVD